MPVDLDRLKQALADRYVVECEVGRGGMAVVYRAHDEQHNRTVALKVLRPEIATSLGVSRFHKEIEIAAGLTHPHVLPVHASGDADGHLYYVMPFVEGESLEERLERKGPLPVDAALRIALEVADGLSYAHEHGVVHRDIKPANILLSSGHAVISDFGIARAIDLAAGDRLTRTGVAVGSMLYMSPEQASGDERVDARTDIYALASVLYEMLGGEPPFTGRTPQAVTARRLTDNVPSLCALRETISPDLDLVVRKALQKVPADRFATALEFAEALQRAVDRPGSAAAMLDAASRPPRSMLLACATATVMVVALSVTLLGRFQALGRSGLAAAGLGLVLVISTALVQRSAGGDDVGKTGRGASRFRRVLRRSLTWERGLAADLVLLAFWIAVATGRLFAGHTPGGSTTAEAGYDPTRVAILYFDDISESKDLGYIARGLTETAIHEFGRVEGLHVVSENGVRGLGNASLDSIARLLNVGTVIDGTVMKSGDRIRVTAQMFATTDMTQIESLQRETTRAEDWLPVIDSIVGDIAVSFRRRLGVAVRVHEQAAGTTDESAFELVQRGEQKREEYRSFIQEGDVDAAALGLRQADSLFAAASSQDQAWLEPLVLRGWVAYDMADLLGAGTEFDPDWLDRGLNFAEQALARRPSSPRALELRGVLRYQKWQTLSEPSCDPVAAAEGDLRRAVSLDETRVRGWVALADLLQYVKGNFKQALNAARTAYEKDSFLADADEAIVRLATLAADVGNYDEAIEWAELGRRRFPDQPRFPALAVHVLAGGGPPDVPWAWERVEATERLASPRTRLAYRTLVQAKMAAVLARADLPDSARAVLERVRAEASPNNTALPQDEARAWLLLGNRDAAISALRAYLEAHPQERAYAAKDLWWGGLRADPRFEALVAPYACEGAPP